MADFVTPVGFNINTHGGDLRIPAGARIVLADNGDYQGYVTADGDIVGHRGQELVADGAAPEAEESAPDSEPTSDVPSVTASPAAQAHAEKHGIDLSQIQGTGKDGTVTKADVVAWLASQTDDTPVEETADGQADPSAAQ